MAQVKSVSDSPLCPPPELQGEEQRLFAAKVDRLIGLFPEAFPTSYYRTPDHNQTVGGVADSLHTEGLAIDLDLLGADESRLTDVGANAVAIGLSAIVYWGSGKSYVHVQARPLKNGSRLLTQRT